MDPIKKQVTKQVTGAALKAAKKRAQKKVTPQKPALKKAAPKKVERAKSGERTTPRPNPAAAKLGSSKRPTAKDIERSATKTGPLGTPAKRGELSATLKSKANQKGGAARQATGNKNAKSQKFEKGQKKAPLTKTEKAGIAGATVATAAFLGKDRTPDKAPMAKKVTTRGPSTEDKIAAEKRRYEARKKAALARAKAQSDYYKKKSSNKGYLTDSEGKRVKSGSGEYVRTRYKCGGEVMKKSKGGAVKGCGVAKRGLGKAMKK